MSCYPILYFEREITAIILCGGLSTRMGSDKGLLKDEQGTLWAEKILKICKNINLPVSLSINQTQVDSYKSNFSKEDLIIDLYAEVGPLGGILTAHNRFMDNDLLVLSCDMQDIDEALLFEILSHHEKLSEYDAVIPCIDGFYQPFPGLYTTELLRKASALFHMKHLETYGLQSLFRSFPIYELTLSTTYSHQMKSYNSINDL